MNILHISDIHYRCEYTAPANGYERMLGKMRDPLHLLTASLERALADNAVDLLVISGDLCDEGSVRDYQTLRTAIDTLTGGLPVVITPGNHDNKAALREGWLGEEASDAPYCIAWDCEQFSLLSFDSSSHGEPNGAIDARTLTWLADNLSARAEQPLLLLTHHHFDEKQAVIPALNPGRAFWALLEVYAPLAILNGHTHHHASGLVHDIPYHTADGMSFCGENLMDGRIRFEEKIGYNLYTIEDGRITCVKTETMSGGRVIDILKGGELA